MIYDIVLHWQSWLDEQAVKSGCQGEAATHVWLSSKLDTATEVAVPFIRLSNLGFNGITFKIDQKRVNTTSGWS